MTRAIALLTCLIAALLLVPAQEASAGIPEYEPEAEVECCDVSCSGEQAPEACPKEAGRRARKEAWHACPPVVTGADGPTRTPPARILHCVFRE